MKNLLLIPVALVTIGASLDNNKSCLDLRTAEQREEIGKTTIDNLLEAYEQSLPLSKDGAKLVFTGVGDRDVYNPTAPFELGGKRFIAGRVESRDSETDTRVMFFTESGREWQAVPGAPVFKLQDPFVSKIGGEFVLGGVEFEPGIGYKTVFFKGSRIDNLKQFAEGPLGMKDIRLASFEGGVLVLTRPQGERPGAEVQPGKGKVGYTVIRNLGELTAEVIEKAPIIEELFVAEEWGGANEIFYLGNKQFGVLGHIAKFDAEGGRHYYATSFKFDLNRGLISDFRIVAARKDLPGGLEGASKRPDLKDVVFSGGLAQEGNVYNLYLGAGDAEVIRQPIANPF